MDPLFGIQELFFSQLQSAYSKDTILNFIHASPWHELIWHASIENAPVLE
jgi:hypothetical protein